MGQPYLEQVGELEQRVHTALSDWVPRDHWAPTAIGPESAFRNKAKLVVGGTRTDPTFGILDGQQRGVDLRACGLYEPPLAEAVRRLAAVVPEIGLTPYDVPARVGELKHLIVTAAPDGQLMVRFVLRSPGQLEKIRRALPDLQHAVSGLRVVSVNLQPQHKAVLEGDEEVVLTDVETLPMKVAGVRLQLRPGSFFQTNTAVAGQLYRQAAEWVAGVGATKLWDLYCGVGGFGLTVAAGTTTPLQVSGVEISAEAVASAQLTASELGRGSFDYRVGDAESALSGQPIPDLVVVNPPRRGIGDLAGWLDASGAQHVIYSSCNVDSLARDLAAMPSYQVTQARIFDMFPQTRHHEVLVRLSRDRRT